MRTIQSSPPVATIDPSGETATPNTPPPLSVSHSALSTWAAVALVMASGATVGLGVIVAVGEGVGVAGIAVGGAVGVTVGAAAGAAHAVPDTIARSIDSTIG